MGKPSAHFFQQALDDIGVATSRAVMIGDDLENDVGGAQACDIRGILVRTGKYRTVDETAEAIRPDLIVNNITGAVCEILKAADER